MGRGRASKSMRSQSRANIDGRTCRGNSSMSMSNAHGKKYGKRPTKAQLKKQGYVGGKQSIVELDGKSWQVVELFSPGMKMYYPTKAFLIQGAGCPIKDGCKDARDMNSIRIQEIKATGSQFKLIAEKWAEMRDIPYDTIADCFISDAGGDSNDARRLRNDNIRSANVQGIFGTHIGRTATELREEWNVDW